MTQFGVTECGELQEPATRNLFSACGQADLPADTFGQLPLFSPFPTAGAWRRRAGTAPFEVTDPGQQVLFVCTQVQLHSRLMCERPQYLGKAVRSLPFHVWVGGRTPPLAQSEVNYPGQHMSLSVLSLWEWSACILYKLSKQKHKYIF